MDVQELIRNIHLIEIRSRKKLQGGLSSSYRNVFRGQGMEFAEVRDYVDGDDVRLIDWNVSARLGDLYVKQLMEERELNIVVAVQRSRSMDYGTGSKTKYQMAVEVACTLIFSAIHCGDRAGLVLFGGAEKFKYIPPNKGMNHGFLLLNRLISQMSISEAQEPYETLKFITYNLKKRSVVFLISDFIYTQWNLEMLRSASRRHDLICIGVLDPSEMDGPPLGCVSLRDASDGEYFVSVNRKTKKSYTEIVNAKIEELSRVFKKATIDYVLLSTDSASELELHRLFMERIQSIPQH